MPDEVIIGGDGIPVVSSWNIIKDENIRIPWVYFGDNPEALAKVDYKPTVVEVRDDVEIKREELFEVKEIEVLPKGVVR